jgi:hypothetical protein
MNLPVGEIDGRATRSRSGASPNQGHDRRHFGRNQHQTPTPMVTKSGERPAVEISMVDVFPEALTRTLTRLSVNGGVHRSSMTTCR